MTGVKLFTIIAAGSLLFMGVLPVAIANEVTPDFSFFDIPGSSPSSETKAKTEAEEPCISCGTVAPKNKPHEALQKIAKSIQAEDADKECVTCGRVTLNGSGVSEKKISTGANLWKQFPQIAGYSDSNAVKKMISYAERHSHRNSLGMCYRYVKEALCGAPRPRCRKDSMVHRYPNGNPVFADRPSKVPRSRRAGVNALKTLKAEGFVNLLEDPKTNALVKNPASAPKGAILVYTGGNNGGHIEIKTGHGTSGSYISDFRAPNSVMKNELAGRASKRYKLVGVLIKPAGKLK